MASDYEAMSHESEGVCWCGTDHRPATGSERIAEVLAVHKSFGFPHKVDDPWHTACICGYGLGSSDEGVAYRHNQHQAEQLAAAGFGHVPTALHQAAEDAEADDGDTFYEGGALAAWLRARADRAGGDHV